MSMAVIVDGQVVYGDATELKNVQLAEVTRELERLQGDVQRLLGAINVAKEALTVMLKDMTPLVRTPIEPPPDPVDMPMHILPVVEKPLPVEQRTPASVRYDEPRRRGRS